MKTTTIKVSKEVMDKIQIMIENKRNFLEKVRSNFNKRKNPNDSTNTVN